MSIGTPQRPMDARGALPFRTNRRDDLVTALLSLWMTTGGVVDAWAHRRLSRPETFFTPWHGIFYTGVLATAGWVFWLTQRNRSSAPSYLHAIPDGYVASVVGVALLAAGGFGDLLWHRLVGIETGLTVLISPTHFVLFVGGILLMAGPLLAAWRDPGYRPERLAAFWPPLLAISLQAATVAYMFQHVEGFTSRLMLFPYRPRAGVGFLEAQLGVLSLVTSTVIVMGALLLLMRRWTLPFGAAAALFGVVGAMMEGIQGFSAPGALVAPVIGGLAADVLIRAMRPAADRSLALRATAFLIPVVMWTVRSAVLEATSRIRWPPTLLLGAIVLTGLAGVGLSLLAFPPKAPARVD